MYYKGLKFVDEIILSTDIIFLSQTILIFISNCVDEIVNITLDNIKL